MAKKDANTHPIPQEIRGLALILLMFLVLLSLISFREQEPHNNWLGLVGYGTAWFLQYTFGMTSFCILAFFGWTGLRYVRHKEVAHYTWRLTFFAIALFSLCILLNIIAENFPTLASLFTPFIYSESMSVKTSLAYKKVRYNLGGVPFYYLYRDIPLISLQRMLSDVGAFLVFFMIFSVAFLQLTKWRLAALCMRLWQRLTTKTSQANLFDAVICLPQSAPSSKPKKMHSVKKEIFLQERPSFPSTLKAKKEIPTPARHSNSGYTLPPLSLLTDVKKSDTSLLKKDLAKQAEILEETLLSFGIEAKVGQIFLGPTIASFEIHPATGVKVQRIKALENDIALNLQAKSIRILAPIPGKACVGVEIPSPKPQEVSFKELLSTYLNGSRKFQIPTLLGQTVTGEDVAADLSKMPHCIIAGATGSGKSVCINTVVMAIIMTARPDEIKLLMVDPKKVELTAYSNLPHLIAPVITEAGGAAAALNWLVKEMERRYELLKQAGHRNITAYNEVSSEKLPYIVGIIDELADLMMVSAQDIETPIARIAQMARAVGIHLILATQRPSREVITGLIKANFPTRIAFKVASRINSQIILDELGAEALLGNGDMLFLPPGTSTLVRAQGAFIRDEDINRVIKFICEQAPPNYLIKSFDAIQLEPDLSNVNDELYPQALGIVQDTGNASTTFLQRKLKIGYARAASLMDLLQANGVVSAQEGSRPRKVLLFKEGRRPMLEPEDLEL